MSLEVVDPGFLSMVQDRGRPDWTHLGVPVGGACDPWSLAVANLLAGNDAGAPAIEMTLVGPTFAVRERTTVGLAGADLGGVVVETGRRLEPGRSHALEAGTIVAFPGPVAGTAGLRAYLALPGGVEAPGVLGSASKALAAGFGGIDGRALRAGDRIAGRSGAADVVDRSWPAVEGDPFAGSWATEPIRIVAGPASLAPGSAALVDLTAGEWRVGRASDRVGLRLEGPDLAPADDAGERLSHGVVFGTIQLPPAGGPIVLLADHQTTGGYPIVAVVIGADHPRLGQLGPGAAVRFGQVSVAEAVAARAAQHAALEWGATALRQDAGWDELWQSAGG